MLNAQHRDYIDIFSRPKSAALRDNTTTDLSENFG